jgi:hypothetical protein
VARSSRMRRTRTAVQIEHFRDSLHSSSRPGACEAGGDSRWHEEKSAFKIPIRRPKSARSRPLIALRCDERG